MRSRVAAHHSQPSNRKSGTELIMKKTLEQLENDYWGEPAYDSYLVTTCHRLRRKPIDDFTTEDLRIMIGQNIGLKYLIPLAMNILRDNPMASGAFYGGDLLAVTIKCDGVQKIRNDGLQGELAQLCLKAITQSAVEEVHEPFDGASPEDFGLSNEAVEQLLQTKIEELKFERPWRECHEFFLKHGRH